eukprot:g12036.t1
MLNIFAPTQERQSIHRRNQACESSDTTPSQPQDRYAPARAPAQMSPPACRLTGESSWYLRNCRPSTRSRTILRLLTFVTSETQA